MAMIDVIIPCYETQNVVDWNLKVISEYPLDVRKALHFILIDDGTIPPLKIEPWLALNLTHLRICKDIPWNHSCARNLGFQWTKHEWVLNIDIDHAFETTQMMKLLNFCETKAEKDSVYYFQRMLQNGSMTNQGRNIYFIHTKSVVFYDEDFCGAYGHPDLFLRRVFERRRYRIFEACGDVVITTIGNTKETSVQSLSRNTKRNTMLLYSKTRQLNAGQYRNGQVIRSEWRFVKELQI